MPDCYRVFYIIACEEARDFCSQKDSSSKLTMAMTKHWCFCAEKWVGFLYLLNVVTNMELWCVNLALESATLGEMKIYYGLWLVKKTSFTNR